MLYVLENFPLSASQTKGAPLKITLLRAIIMPSAMLDNGAPQFPIVWFPCCNTPP